MIAGAAAILAAALAVTIVAFTRERWLRRGRPNLRRRDRPTSNNVVHAVDLGFKSNLIASGEGYVWVVDPNGSTLWRIDPRTRETKNFGIAVGAGAIPFGLAAGHGSVWVAVLRGTQEVVLELGPDVGDLRRTIPYGDRAQAPVLFRLNPLAVGAGAVWAIDPGVGAVWRIDPRTGRRRKLAEGLDALSLAAGSGAVWVAGASGVTKLDALTGLGLGSATTSSQAGGETSSVALGANAVWFTASSGQTLSEIDPQSLATTQTFSVGDGPSGIAVGEGSVWVANSGERNGLESRRRAVSRVVGSARRPGIVAAYGAVDEPGRAPG
jgi:streptogramin lyase